MSPLRAHSSNMYPRHTAMHALLACAFMIGACGELPGDSPLETPAEPHASTIQASSTQGCSLDDDCVSDMHCFMSLCVLGCTDDANCDDGSRCNARGRCIHNTADPLSADVHVLRTIDGALDDEKPSALPGIYIDEVTPQRVMVSPSMQSVDVTLHLSGPLPNERIDYVLAFHDDETRSPVKMARGKEKVTISIPLDREIPEIGEAQGLDIITSAGRTTVYLTRSLPVDGLYFGDTRVQTFGGAALPIELMIQTSPSSAETLDTANERFLLIPTSAQRILNLPEDVDDQTWMRTPLEWDEDIDAWVATFATPIDNLRVFGELLYPLAERTLRVELRPSASEEGMFVGAWTDRWNGIADRHTVEGVPTRASYGISGTLNVQHKGARPDVPVHDASYAPAPWTPQPPPAFEHCTDSQLAAVPGDDDEPSSCQRIGEIAHLPNADVEDITNCALQFANTYDAPNSVQEDLYAFLDPAQDNPYGMSFDAYLDACAQRTQGICVPHSDAECGRELTAYAYSIAHGTPDTLNALAASYERFTREIFLGAKLAAFHSDTTHRLQWLQSSEAPIFLAGPLKDYNEQILRHWRERVADTLLDALLGQLDGAGLAFLGKAAIDEALMAQRATMLLDLVTLWQAAADALTLLADRQNVIEQNDIERATQGRRLYNTFYRLYLSGIILAELSRETGIASQSSAIGVYLSALDASLRTLSLPFDDLIFARAAEVVTATSLDPTTNSRSLLGERKDDAFQAVERARRSVDMVLNEAQVNKLTHKELEDRYEDQIIALRNELISLCGLPQGCDAEDVGIDARCDVPTTAQQCGFALTRDSDDIELPQDTATSEAAVALHALWAAIEGHQIILHEQNAALSRVTLIAQSTEDFAQSIQQRQRLREATEAEIGQLASDIRRLRNNLLTAQLDTIEQQQKLREQAFQQQTKAVREWSKTLSKGVNSDMKRMRNANTASANADILNYAGDRAKAAADVIGASMTTSALGLQHLKLIPLSIGFAASTALGSAAVNQNIRADTMRMELEGAQQERDRYITEIQDSAALNAKRSATEVAAIEAEIGTLELQNSTEEKALRALIASLKDSVEADERLDRELLQLRDRRDELLQEVEQLRTNDYQLAQSNLTIEHHVLAYLQIVQRAEILSTRFINAKDRWDNLENILGSPDVIFSFSNRIALAENQLERARKALEDWLIGLEYYAVRPFLSQRIAIRLARNPQQLEAIAHELARLQQSCGGATSTEHAQVSLRDNLLRLDLNHIVMDEHGQEIISTPAQRLRALLARAPVPTHRHARLNSKETLGRRMQRGNLLSANFTLATESFANLPQTCNAKVDSIAVRLLGIEAENTQPVVTIVYDGESQLRSCHANIRDVVYAAGPKATAFGTISRFRTGARAISPVAGIEDMGPPSTWNSTLEGTPLAAGYTLLIDLEHPSNQAVDWRQLEDVELLFAYTYQDQFPDGQCE